MQAAQRLGQFGRENWMTLAIVAVLMIAFLTLRMSPTDIASVEGFLGELGQGTPKVVVLYSNV